MPSFHNGEVEIAYLDEGEGEPIVLVHGFASNKEVNWVNPAGSATLTRAGRRVIALDNRGHGAVEQALRSGRLSHAADGRTTCARCSIISRIERADVMGYSMGARITAFLARRPSGARALGDPRRPRHPLVDGGGLPAQTHRRRAGGAVARRRDAIRPAARSAAFAEQTKSDLKALAACIRGSRQTLSRAQVAAHPRAGAGRGRHQGRGRRLRRRNWPRSSRARGRSTSPTATTCWRSATRCSKPACWTSLTSAA